MRIPTIKGIIDRRVLVNYRVDPAAIEQVLPAPFRPQIHGDDAIAGICLIRLTSIRPRGLPAIFGISSENAAHRIAVEWDTPTGTQCGVYIPRRDTSSHLNATFGGRLFPGVHHLAEFQCKEDDDSIDITMRAKDGGAHLRVRARITDKWSAASVFDSMRAASSFFEAGSIGYSATNDSRRFDGLELRTQEWRVEALAIDEVQSSFFDDASHFPHGSASFDCALLMRDIAHEWRGLPKLCCEEARTAAGTT